MQTVLNPEKTSKGIHPPGRRVLTGSFLFLLLEKPEGNINFTSTVRTCLYDRLILVGKIRKLPDIRDFNLWSAAELFRFA